MAYTSLEEPLFSSEKCQQYALKTRCSFVSQAKKSFRKLTSRPHHYLCASYQLSGKCWSHISSDNAVLRLFWIILHCRAKVMSFRDFLQHRISEWNGHKEFLRKLWLASGAKTTVFSLFKVNLMHHSQQTYYKAFSINWIMCGTRVCFSAASFY